MRSLSPGTTRERVYESTLYRFALDHADLTLADFVPPVGTERLEEFIDNNWGEKAAGTRAKNISILRSFFTVGVRARTYRR
jgi:hypothetical protein